MICFIALIVFGILGIFSVKYRAIAKEAFECTFLKMTFRPCKSRLDERLKAQISGGMMRRSPKAGMWIFRNFEILSWIFTVLLVASMAYTAFSTYNYIQYGNCNGPDSGGFCIYDALASDTCSLAGQEGTAQRGELDPSAITPNDDPRLGSQDAKVIVIEFGCYSCHYTKQAEPIVKQLLDKYGGRILYVYRDFHIPTHPNSDMIAQASGCAIDQGMFWQYHDLLFEKQDDLVETLEMSNNSRPVTADALATLAESLGMDRAEFLECLSSEKYVSEVEGDSADGKAAGIYGTPTFFINNRTIVGPKPIRAFTTIIDEELKK